MLQITDSICFDRKYRLPETFAKLSIVIDRDQCHIIRLVDRTATERFSYFFQFLTGNQRIIIKLKFALDNFLLHILIYIGSILLNRLLSCLFLKKDVKPEEKWS